MIQFYAQGSDVEGILAAGPQDFSPACADPGKSTFGHPDDRHLAIQSRIQVSTQTMRALIVQQHIAIRDDGRRHTERHLAQQTQDAGQFAPIECPRRIRLGDGTDLFKSLHRGGIGPVLEGDAGRAGQRLMVAGIKGQQHSGIKTVKIAKVVAQTSGCVGKFAKNWFVFLKTVFLHHKCEICAIFDFACFGPVNMIHTDTCLNRWYRHLGWLCCWLLLGNLPVYGQTTLWVVSCPPDTPPGDTLYVVGDFNDWTPGDPRFRLLPYGPHQWIITLPDKRTSFEYKFTRGSWETVEVEADGKGRSNRAYRGHAERSDTIRVAIAAWDDLSSTGIAQTRQGVTFVVSTLPENTPHDATIYVAGNFNDWDPGDPRYRLQPMPNGKYAITLPPVEGNYVEYKFTRGNWRSVEGRANGQAIPNRTFVVPASGRAVIESDIISWEDLEGHKITFYNFFMLLSAFQGCLLVAALFGLQDNNRRANQTLSILLLTVSGTLILRVVAFYRDVFQWQPKLLMASDLIYFLYAPLFYLYLRRLLFVKEKSSWRTGLHFVPALLLVLAYSPFWLMTNEQFINDIVDRKMSLAFTISGGIGLLYNAIYLWEIRRTLHFYRQRSDQEYSFEQNLHNLYGVVYFLAFCLFIWSATYLTGVLGLVFGINTTPATEMMTDTIWVIFSGMTYFLGYLAMRQPEIFRMTALRQPNIRLTIQEVVQPALVPEADEKPEEKVKDPAVVQEVYMPIARRLDELIVAKKPYKSAKLTINELADMLDVHPHLLSRVINEVYDKNFYDYINTFRVEEFKKIALLDKYRNQTFLAVSMEVGFNSKTAFNRAFKKHTGQTPREYFKSIGIQTSAEED